MPVGAMDRVSSKLFIGREVELDVFRRSLAPESEIKIFTVHTHGEGGIGKTQLLLKMQDYCRNFPEKFVFSKELIDFYQVETHFKPTLMKEICTNLGLNKFPKFQKLVEALDRTKDPDKTEKILSKLENTFSDEYERFALNKAKEGTSIVIFFDTYEVIQGYEETTDFSRWVESKLFPLLSRNTLLVVSGRYPLNNLEFSDKSIQEIVLPHFKLDDTIMFLKECFKASSRSELIKRLRLSSEASFQILHNLADGRPTLLALFADWVNYERNHLSSEDLLKEILKTTGKITETVVREREQKKLFERRLIERISSLIKPEDLAVTYMAIAYHRMTPSMLAFLLDTSLEEAENILLERLKSLSFIKYKHGNIVLLHDEMRRLILELWWDSHDTERNFRRIIAQKLVQYYEERLLTEKFLSEANREVYFSEFMEYALLENPLRGLDHFRSEFDNAMESGRYYYADLLLREAEKYFKAHPDDIPFPDFLKIKSRRIRYNADTDTDYQMSKDMAEGLLEEFKERADWKNNVERGYILYLKGMAEVRLGNFDDAVVSFENAKKIFFDAGEDVFLYRANNWLGLAFFRQGNLQEARDWWIGGLEGFYTLLERKTLSLKHSKYDLRRLIQGIQHGFGNLAILYRYTEKSEIAIRYAEIQLNIVRQLQRNNREIARAGITINHAMTYAGHSIDARHHAVEAANLLERHQIRDRMLIGRLKTNLSLLTYRSKELAYLLEYYRAEEIEQIVAKTHFIDKGEREQAHKLIQEAIVILSQFPEISKELADAYYVQGELCMVTPARDHWRQSEQALEQALIWAQKSQFRYRIVDTLESLVTLYYFWNGMQGIDETLKRINEDKLKRYSQMISSSDYEAYPNLCGKYEITLGDIQFDRALQVWETGSDNAINGCIDFLKTAYCHYVKAAHLMKNFNMDRYHLALRVFYNRLNTLLEKEREKRFPEGLVARLGEVQGEWGRGPAEFEQLYQYVILQHTPLKNRKILQELEEKLNEACNIGNFGWALLLNDCLIGLYIALFNCEQNDTLQEKIIWRLNDQIRFYRILRDEYHAEKYARLTQDYLEKRSLGSILKKALEGYLDWNRGTTMYRRGEYGRLLELYLHDELDVAQAKFDKQYPGMRERALELLKDAEGKLGNAVSLWQNKLKSTLTISQNENAQIEANIQRYQKGIAETKFRLGELQMLNKEFIGKQGAFHYLQEAVNKSAEVGDEYRRQNAMQCYVNALYFAGEHDSPEFWKTRKEYEDYLEYTLKKSGNQRCPSVMGRLRIVQGDMVFSQYFQRELKDNEYYVYVHPKGLPNDIQKVRNMLRCYVEACNFMIQMEGTLIYFAAAVRVLQRRIELIADLFALEEIQEGFHHIWREQSNLKDKNEELEMLMQFAAIRSALIRYEEITE